MYVQLNEETHLTNKKIIETQKLVLWCTLESPFILGFTLRGPFRGPSWHQGVDRYQCLKLNRIGGRGGEM